jgi:hypothetical protein
MPRTPRIIPKTNAPVIQFTEQGRLVANCTRGTCPRSMQSILEFAPVASNMNHRQRAAFFKIVAAIDALDDRDCDKTLDGLLKQLGITRRKMCLTCRLIEKKTQENPDTKRGACRAKWLEIRARLEEHGCVACGRNDAMTVEHGIPELKMRDKKGDSVNLGSYGNWPTFGGPAAMEAELQKPGVVPMCVNCQLMQPTHDAMKPKINPDDLPDVRVCDDQAAYNKKHDLVVRDEKRYYVDTIKINEFGKCEDCGLVVVPSDQHYEPGANAYPHAFQFAHRSELDKEHNVSKLVTSRATLKTEKPKIDKEISRCRLLCMCCGHLETRARSNEPGPSEEGN